MWANLFAFLYVLFNHPGNFVAAAVTLTGFALSTGNYVYRRKVQADKTDILLQPGKELDEYESFEKD